MLTYGGNIHSRLKTAKQKVPVVLIFHNYIGRYKFVNYSIHITHACNIQFTLCNIFINHRFVYLNILMLNIYNIKILFVIHNLNIYTQNSTIYLYI